MIKIVVNKCFGGFGLSHKAYEYIAEKYPNLVVNADDNDTIRERSRQKLPYIYDMRISEFWNKYAFNAIGTYWESNFRDEEMRTHPILIEVIEKFGEGANGRHADLEIVEISGGVWFIQEYDGVEWVTAVETCERCGQPLNGQALCDHCGAPRDDRQITGHLYG